MEGLVQDETALNKRKSFSEDSISEMMLAFESQFREH